MRTPLEEAREYARLLRLRDREAAAELTREYLKLVDRLNRQIADMIKTARGKSARFKRERLEVLHAQYTAELDVYASFAGSLITQSQRVAINLAIEQAAALFELIRERSSTTLVASASWTRAPVEALQMLVGKLSDGTVLGDYLKAQAGKNWPKVKAEIINGLATGRHPRRTAAAVAKALNGNLVSALTTSREAQVGTFNEATLEQYRANPKIVNGYVRLSALGPRTCALCWALHGKFYELGDALLRHLECRCTTVPAIDGYPITVQDGEAYFATLEPEEQKKILHPGEYDLYREGKIRLASLVDVKESKRWGPTLRRKTLKELRAETE